MAGIKGNLLIVEDEEIGRRLLSLRLEDLAEKIFLATNGQEGLEQLASQDIHCVITDIRMPVMDGIEFIKRVRESGSEVPIVIYTGHGDQRLMLEALKFGVFDFVGKPRLENLEDTITRGLREGFVLTKNSDERKKIHEQVVSEYQKLLSELDKKD